jgi:transglutaminase-like putative cysteine protease
MDATLGRSVSAQLTFDVTKRATIVLQVRPATTAGEMTGEQLDLALDGAPLARPDTIDADYGGLLHVITADPGTLTIRYRADLATAATITAPDARPGTGALERLEMTRPSRYCPSDHVLGLALAEFGPIDGDGAKTAAIASWIFERIEYVAGFTDVHDSAEHTLLTGKGVCRDFAHLGVLLCRALDVPARFASVYAPGLDPMDFHAVFEAWHDDAWWVYDATRLAPRQSLVRIGTGRDAADTSFASVTSGFADLEELAISAVSSGDLPVDDHSGRVALA